MPMNLLMKGLLDSLKNDPPPSMPVALSALLADGFVTQEGFSFLRGLRQHNQSTIRALRLSETMYQDETGYECFVNHLHIDDYAESDSLPLAMAFAGQVGSVWLSTASENTMRVIVSHNDSGSVVRCHLVRPNQSWLAEDLDSYEQDAVWFEDFIPED